MPFSLVFLLLCCTDVTLRVLVFFKFGYWDTLNFVRSPCLPSWRGLRLYAVHQMLSLCSLYSNSPLSSRPQPLGRVGDDTPCEDTREDFGLFV